jgi:hypothetical protein
MMIPTRGAASMMWGRRVVGVDTLYPHTHMTQITMSPHIYSEDLLTTEIS